MPQDDNVDVDVDVDDYEADDEKENADCGDDVDDLAYDDGGLMITVMKMLMLLVTECMGWSSDVCTRTVPPPIHWSGQSEVAEHETFTRKIKKNQKR